MAATVTDLPSTTTTPNMKLRIPPIPPTVPTGIAYLCNTDANRSVMCWYDNASVSQDGVTLPQATDPIGPSDVTWEGQPMSGLIMNSDSPTDFTCDIGVNAQAAAFRSQVGTASLLLIPSPGQPASTSYFADFNCFKDNGRVLYTDGNFGQVYSIYYCLFANSFHGTG
jgi:hypothetical protein